MNSDTKTKAQPQDSEETEAETDKARFEKDYILETGSVLRTKGRHAIHCLTVIGQIVKDAIKAHMGDSETAYAGEYKITWKPVTTVRIDTTALKKAMPEVAQAFTRQTTARRFTLA